MTNESKSARDRAEARFDEVQTASGDARSIAEAELHAARAKTARLRKLRLGKEMGPEVVEPDTKPARKKAKPKRRA